MSDEGRSACSRLLNLTDAAESLHQILLSHFGSDQELSLVLSKVDRESDSTILMLAAKLGRFDCCKLLIKLSPESVMVENSERYTAIKFASYYGHLPVVLLLLDSIPKEKHRKHLRDSIQSALDGNQTDLAKRIEEFHDGETLLEMETFGTLYENTFEPSSRNDVNWCNKRSRVQKSNPITKTYEAATSVVKTAKSISSKQQTVPESKFSKFEASMMFLTVTSVNGSDGNQSLVGIVFPCLKTVPGGEDKPSDGKDCDLFVGRSSQNDVVLSDMSLSKSHAVISYFENKGFLVRDLGSKHGTFVNGKRIGVREGNSQNRSSQLYLQDGFEVRFGRVFCKVFRKKQEPVLLNQFVPNPEAAFKLEQERIMHNASSMLQQKEKDKRKREQDRAEMRKRQQMLPPDPPSTAIPHITSSALHAVTVSAAVLQAERDKDRDRGGLGSGFGSGQGLPYDAVPRHGQEASASDSRREATWKKARERFFAIPD